MTSNIEFKYNGKVYQPTLEESPLGCSGCAFFTENETCASSRFPKIDQDVVWKCASLGFIWEEKDSNKSEPSVLVWTEQEIRDAWQKWDGSGGVSGFLSLLSYKQDPEYQKYLELKAKFGE